MNYYVLWNAFPLLSCNYCVGVGGTWIKYDQNADKTLVNFFNSFKSCGDRHGFIKAIFQILFSKDENDLDRLNVIRTWLSRQIPLLAVIFILIFTNLDNCMKSNIQFFFNRQSTTDTAKYGTASINLYYIQNIGSGGLIGQRDVGNIFSLLLLLMKWFRVF